MASVSLTASGIQFSDYQTNMGAGMTSELLDHYEEGTWSPTSRVASGTDSGYTEYTRAGRIVNLWTSYNHPTSSSNSTQYIDGLPFANSTLAYGPVIIGYSSYTATEGLRSVIWGGNSYISFYPDNAANPELSATNLSGKRTDLCGVYIAG